MHDVLTVVTAVSIGDAYYCILVLYAAMYGDPKTVGVLISIRNRSLRFRREWSTHEYKSAGSYI